MIFVAAVAAILTTQADTVRLPAAAALDRAAANASQVLAAAARTRAATAGVRQARQWRNPMLSVLAENLGAQEATTGYSGLKGVEGQATLAMVVPLGGDIGHAEEQAQALEQAAQQGGMALEAMLRYQTLSAIAAAERDAQLGYHAREELRWQETFALAMARRAEEGRASGGEAARAAIEAGLAATNAARRDAEASSSQVQLARLLTLDPNAAVVVEAPACEFPARVGSDSGPAELRVADAQARAAEAAVLVAKARAFPDLMPQIGLRRTAGFSGLLLGIALDLPLFNAGGAQKDMARADAEAARAEQQDLIRRIQAERASAEATLVALDRLAPKFSREWQANLERTLTSAQARYESGEGTLAELLDSRRARLAALGDYESWRAQRHMARALLARLSGAPIDATLLCDPTEAGSQ